VLAVLRGELMLAEAAGTNRGGLDNRPCFRGTVFAATFAGDDPLLRHVRTMVRSPPTNGVVDRFFGTLKDEHLYRAIIADGDGLAVEIALFRQTNTTLCPHQALADRPHAKAYLAHPTDKQ
jgi:putative transposase